MAKGPVPPVVVFTQNMNIVSNPIAIRGASIITVPNVRWNRRDIKIVGLSAQALAKQAALEANADDAWLVDDTDGFVTEGASSKAFIISNRHPSSGE
jgi:D-alanine transaminase